MNKNKCRIHLTNTTDMKGVKNEKKLVSVLLVAAMGASVLAGCGSSSVKKMEERRRANLVVTMFWSSIMDIIRMKVSGLRRR